MNSNERDLVNISNAFKSHTSAVVVVRPVKSLIQSLKHISAIRLYSRKNSRN